MATVPTAPQRRRGGARKKPSAPSAAPAAINRREQAYVQLRADIINGRLAPGDPLTEMDLATAVGVSRTPIREALQRLAVEGLVTWVPGRGAFVSALSVPDIVELLQLREALESFAARLAARSEGHRGIAKFLDEFETSRSRVNAGDSASYNRLTEAFDRAVVQLAANGRVGSALEEVWAQSTRVRRLAYRNIARIRDSIDEHQRIVRAIAAGQEEEAAAAVADHIRRSLQNVIESLASGSIARPR